MIMNRTIKFKLELSKEDMLKLISTMGTASKIYNKITEYGFKNKTHNKIKVHNATYKQIRQEHPSMPSSLVQGIRDVACESLKGVKLKTQPISNEFSAVRYNKRVITIKYSIKTASIATTYGRIKVRFNIPEYYHKYLNWDIKTSTLCFNRKKCQFYLHTTIEKQTPELNIATPEVLGIDRGIVNIAVCSNNIFFNGKQIKNVRAKYKYLRQKLQSIGTRSAKRKLKRISEREKRFVTNTNHVISKSIVNMPYNVIAIEDLKSIRVQKRRINKQFKTKLNNWSFYQLEQFLTYKCELQGKKVILVDARYTSQKCSKCGDIRKNNRKGFEYKCKKCGFELHADLNASRNIAQAGISCLSRLPVNQPIVAI